jgi:hypothetical protein
MLVPPLGGALSRSRRGTINAGIVLMIPRGISAAGGATPVTVCPPMLVRKGVSRSALLAGAARRAV